MYKRKRAGNTITRKINSTKDTAAKADKNHYISNSYLEGFIPIDTEYFTASLENSISGRYSIIKVPLFALCRLKLCLQHNRQCVHKCINQFVDLFFGQFGIVLKDRTEHLQQHLKCLYPCDIGHFV